MISLFHILLVRSALCDDSGSVVTLTESNFEELVLRSDEPVLVEFFAPWCGHCKNLEPEWAKAAASLSGKVKLGAVDATQETQLAQKYGVNSYPTIKVFRNGEIEEYNGPREAEGIEKYVLENIWEGALEPVRVEELVDQQTFDSLCNTKTCIIAVLPDILDTGAEGRNQFIATLTALATRARRDPFAFVWTAARAQPKLEDMVSIAAYPSVIAVSGKKKRFAVMITAWTRPNLGDFLVELLTGRAPTVPYDSLSLDTISAWDGKDGQVFEEEEFDLSELGIEINQEEPPAAEEAKEEL
eukprot:gb/GEZN01010730.1/.p1 GENE.gb/GEZN01010730.1/~~gb/GEZN01010730.1/.p1  ORF type:complete len:299 (+),score=46.09 gb/GEZN01010730.1/:62-958(+)